MLKNKSFIFLTLIILSHIFILFKMVFLPTPELFIYPYLTNIGLKPYLQILDQHFPGLMFLPINFDNLGMNNEVIARFWLLGVVIITQLLIFFISRRILKSDKRALLVNLLYLIWQPFFEGWVLWLDTFLPLFLLPAFYYIHQYLDGNSKLKNLYFAGLFLGLGVIFKQVLLPISFLVLGYVFLHDQKPKATLAFLYGFLPPVVLMLIYFWNIGVLGDFWYWTIIFNLTTFAEEGRKIAPTSQLIKVLFVTIFSLTAFFIKDKKLLALLFIFVVLPIVEIYNRFDYVHFQPALPFIVLATVMGLTENFKNKIKIFGILFYGVIILRWLTIFYSGHISNHIYFFDSHTKELAFRITQYTTPNERIFIFGEIPHIYQMTQTRPAGDIFVFQFPWFMHIAEKRILEGIKKDQPNIIVYNKTVVIEGQRITDFASQINEYISENYQKIDSVGLSDILRRRDN